ncbi:MAG: arylsulfatase [Planctomycetota bacterium]
MRNSILVALFLALGSCRSTSVDPSAASSQRAQARPNVVVVFVDDLGVGELGCYGQERIRTPHIDSISANGVRFTNAYTGSPVCAPARCVLLTGRHSGHAVVRANWENGGWGPDEPEGQWPLPASEETLAERLHALGYRTGGFGKWGLGGPGTEGAPERQGFDHFYGYLCQRVAHNYYPTHLWRDGVREPIPGNAYFPAHQTLDAPLSSAGAYGERFGRGREGYAPARIADDMIEWLEDAASADEPFFLYYASIIPHLALQVPADVSGRYPSSWDEEPYLGDRGYLPHPSPRRAYAGMISFLDDQVGRILGVLEANGALDDTVVLFTSDNGASYVGGVDTAFFGSHDGRRGHKGQLWEGGIRVPFIAQWPGRFPAGATSDHLVSSLDVTATLLDLIGAAPAAGLDSESFASVLANGTSARPRSPLYWEYRPFGGQAVRDGRWKLVRTGLKKGEPKLHLFDLDDDPAESRNVAEENPDVVARLEAFMDRSHVPSVAFPLPTVDDPASGSAARTSTP